MFSTYSFFVPMQNFENAVRTRVNVRICAKARMCVSFALHVTCYVMCVLNVFVNHFFGVCQSFFGVCMCVYAWRYACLYCI